MKMLFINKTEESQHINLTDGSAISIPPLGRQTVDSWKIYDGELKRIKRFFDMSFEGIENYIEEEL